TYDAGTVNSSLVAFAPQEWSAVVSNWTVGDPGGVTPLKIAGPGSVALSTVGGAVSVSADGGAATPVSAYSTQSSGAPTSGRRLIASGVAAGAHTVVLTVASGTCIFDFLQAAVL